MIEQQVDAASQPGWGIQIAAAMGNRSNMQTNITRLHGREVIKPIAPRGQPTAVTVGHPFGLTRGATRVTNDAPIIGADCNHRILG